MKISTINILSILLMAVAMPCLGQVPTDNLLAYYPFNGNANDESSNSNNATVSGANLTMDRFGNASSAYNFSNPLDAISIAHSSLLNFDNSVQSHSISFWFRSLDPTSTTSCRIMEKWTDVGGDPYPIFIIVEDVGEIAAANYDGSNISWATYNAPLWNNEWHHGVVIYTAQTISMYIDASLVSTASVAGLSPGFANNAEITIGNNLYLQRPYVGDLDDLRFYGDELTECEVYALFIEGNPNFITNENVVVCSGESYLFPDDSLVTNITSNFSYTSYLKSELTGCDSAYVETSVIVDVIDTSVVQSGNSLTSAASGLSYQWIDCGNGNAIIQGATNQTFTPTVNGDYAVVLNNGLCTDTSNCMNAGPLGLEELSQFASIYPNPFNTEINLSFGSIQSNVQCSLLNSVGSVIFRESYFNSESINVEVEVAAGVYFLVVTVGNRSEVVKVIKD
ncbi:MAG: hypothetical protein Crog4KO_10940 [Crocinitomicaceae bacterium]